MIFYQKILSPHSQRTKNSIPSKEDIDDIWAYMNFHLNFVRLLEEKEKKNSINSLNGLNILILEVSPDNVFAKYFLGYLHQTIEGKIPYTLISDLKNVLNKMQILER